MQELALGCSRYITTVVYQHDVIPRASLAGFEALRREMLATQWEENLTAEVSSVKNNNNNNNKGSFILPLTTIFGGRRWRPRGVAM